MNSTIFSRFLRALRRRQLTQKVWKMVWFSMSLYKFKSSLCSPCNQSTQRRRKVYRCWVSSSPIKRAEHETCKYNVNHHGWAHHQGENQIHFFQCRKYQMDSSHHSTNDDDPFRGRDFYGWTCSRAFGPKDTWFWYIFVELLKNMCPCNNGVISKKHGITTNKKCSTVQFCWASIVTNTSP